jgi:hypothetical protein
MQRVRMSKAGACFLVEPIMSRELWERVQAKLCGHAVRDG